MLKEIKKHLNKRIKVISFDIFDTIIFRMTKKPVDVFGLAAEKALQRGILQSHILPQIYQNLRIEAEKKARKNKQDVTGSNEVTLREIISYIPDQCLAGDHLLESIEIETEMEVCYLNPDIQAVMKYLHQAEYRIILTSDMYLSENNMLELLEKQGFPVEFIEKLFVSCEIGLSKQTGGLYTYICEQLHIQPDEMLHIGDNYITDVVNAQYLGIQTFYYHIISNAPSLIFSMEQLKYGNRLPEIESLRKYVGAKAVVLPDEQIAWFQMGAMVFGPLMTGVTEWVLDTAEQQQISCIFPLMREGMLLSRLLEQAASFRKKSYRIEPIYISRKAVLLPSLRTWNAEAWEIVLLMKKATVKTLFEMLELDLGPFTAYQDVKLTELNLFQKDYVSLASQLKQWLFSKDKIIHINNKIARETKQLQTYLDQLNLPKKFITFDLGIRGTMQKALSDLIGFQHDIMHLLIFGAKENVEKILNGIDIRGYVGNAGNNEDMVFDVILRPELWEQMMMCDLGTTIGYTEEGTPVTKTIDQIALAQYQKVAWCQKGMLAFQQEYLQLKRKKPWIQSMESKVRDTANLVFRFINMPTLEEAVMFKDFQFDENLGIDHAEYLYDESELEQLQTLGVTSWLSKHKAGQIKWEEGLITRVFPTYYFDKEVQKTASDYEKSIIQLAKQVVKKHPKQVVICGAGEAGRMMQTYLDIYGISIESFTDQNVKLQGTGLQGIPVRTLKDAFETNHYVIASFAYAKEIRNEILEIKGNGAEIYSLDN